MWNSCRGIREYPARGAAMFVDPGQLKRAQQGSAEAFEAIARACQPRVDGTLRRLIEPEDAPEAGVEVFLHLHSSLGQITPELFERWLYRITVNTAYDYRRRMR
jgi:DNA-directed RNA polymerase specialized sigma24 family protein